MLSHVQTEEKEHCPLCNLSVRARARVVSLFSSLASSTHPLLPQLLLQRGQAAFLPQHAAVPPAEGTSPLTQCDGGQVNPDG